MAGGKFDERQKRERDRSYRVGFIVLAAYFAVIGILELMSVRWDSPVLKYCLGFCLGMSAKGIYQVVKGAYLEKGEFAQRQNKLNIIWLGIFILFHIIIVFTELAEDGMWQLDSILIAATWLLLWLPDAFYRFCEWNKKEMKEAEQEADDASEKTG